MFEGVPEQYHQFITSSTRTPTTTLPLPFPTTTTAGAPSSSLHHHHHHHHHPNFPSFDIPSFPSSHNNQPLQHQVTQFLHHHAILQPPPPPPPHQPPPPPLSTHKIITNGDHKQDKNNGLVVGMDLDIKRNERLPSSVNPDQDLHPPPWSNDEILALLRIRSSMENWFPEFTWEHVSRKLAEVGFKRSAEKCKEKFEEESRYFNNNINYNNNKGNTNNNNNNNHTNYRMFSELEELCHGEHHSHDQNPHDHLLLPSSVDHEHHHEKKMNPSDDQENLQDKVVVVGEDNLEDHEEVETVDADKDDDNDDNEEEDRPKSESFKIADGNGEMGVNEKSKSSNKRKIRGSSSLEKKSKKKKEKFEDYFKGFCEEIVSKMMIQQEKMQDKLLEDMMKRDEEKVAIEEEWKKQEIDRVNKEFEIRRHEQQIVDDRQSTIINFLKKITSSTSNFEGITTNDHHQVHSQNQDLVSHSSPQSSSSLVGLPQNPNNTHQSKNHELPKSQSPTSNNPNSISPLQTQVALSINPNPTSVIVSPKPSPSSIEPTTQNPNSLNTQKDLHTPKPFGAHKSDSDDHRNHDIGKRWPRDEVLALINLRCKNNGDIVNSHEQKEGSSPLSSVKATPLWERISKGMLEMGYKRSSKRCKEKWENINKYFRKTKDNVKKKRSTESRTCPYFQQLSTLYGQGALANNNNQNHPPPPPTTTTTTTALPEDAHLLDLPKTTQGGGSSDVNDEKGEKSTKVQVPAFGFEF